MPGWNLKLIGEYVSTFTKQKPNGNMGLPCHPNKPVGFLAFGAKYMGFPLWSPLPIEGGSRAIGMRAEALPFWMGSSKIHGFFVLFVHFLGFLGGIILAIWSTNGNSQSFWMLQLLHWRAGLEQQNCRSLGSLKPMNGFSSGIIIWMLPKVVGFWIHWCAFFIEVGCFDTLRFLEKGLLLLLLAVKKNTTWDIWDVHSQQNGIMVLQHGVGEGPHIGH